MTASATPATPPPARSGEGAHFWIVLASLVAAELTCALEGNMVTVALSKLYGLYGDPLHVTWLITAYALTSAATAAICSRLGDLYGRRKLLMIMLMFAAVGSLISAFGTSLNVIILGRAIQGASMAVLPLAFGILRETARNDRQLNIGVGVLGGTFSFSTGLGILLGGVIIDHLPWQNIFLASAGVAIGSLLLVWRVLAKDRPRKVTERLDLVGGVGFVFPITALLLSLNSGKAWGWDSPITWSLLIGGVAGLALWVVYELRVKNPLIDLRLFRTPQIAIANLVICSTAMGPMIYPQVLMPLLQQPVWTGVGLGITATMAGVIKLPTNLTSGVGAIVSGYVAQRFTMRRIVILAAAANLVAFVILMRWHDSVWYLVLAAVLLIAPAGTIMFGCAPGLIIDASPEDRTSVATGMTSVLRAIAQGVGSQLIALCLATSAVVNAAGAQFPDEQAYLTTFVYVAGCCAVSLLFAVMIPRPKPAVALTPALAE
jgi:MFS family permease